MKTKIFAAISLLACLLVTLYFVTKVPPVCDSETCRMDQTVMTMDRLAEVINLVNAQYGHTKISSLDFLTKANFGLADWKGPYLAKSEIVDAWQNEIEFVETGEESYNLISAGPDEIVGNKDDIIKSYNRN